MQRRPVVGISMLTLRPGQMGGSERYARALTGALAEHGTLEYVCFVPRAAPDAGHGLETVLVPEYLDATRPLRKGPAMALAALRPGPIRRRFARASAMHYPFTVPLPTARAPTALSLQDVLHLDEPRLCGRQERLFRRFAYDRPARRADRVIVPSEYVRGRACERLGLADARVRTIPHAVDHAVFRPGDESREPFLVYPAKPWPHKNHARLLEAFRRFRARRPEFELVLTGGGHEHAAAPGVRALGLVSDAELSSLYRRAAALVFPSLHEGFGLPPLEAMASGCPVAASRASSLPEICGDAAVFFDPRDEEEMAFAMERALDQGDALRERGYRRAAAFDWATAAGRHETVYRELLEP